MMDFDWISNMHIEHTDLRRDPNTVIVLTVNVANININNLAHHFFSYK